MSIAFGLSSSLSVDGLITISGSELAPSGVQNRARWRDQILLTNVDSGVLRDAIVAAAGVISVNGATGAVSLTGSSIPNNYVGFTVAGTTISVTGSPFPTLSGVTLAGGTSVTGDASNLYIVPGLGVKVTPSTSSTFTSFAALPGNAPFALKTRADASAMYGYLGSFTAAGLFGIQAANAAGTAATGMVLQGLGGNVLVGNGVTEGNNGVLQLATHTTSGGGIGFGPSASLWSNTTAELSTNSTLRATGTVHAAGFSSRWDNGFNADVTLSASSAGGGAARVLYRDTGSDRWALGYNVGGASFGLYNYTVGGLAFSVAAATSLATFTSGVALGITGDYTANRAASVAQLLAASGWLTNSTTSNVVYTTGTQTITGAKSWNGGTFYNTTYLGGASPQANVAPALVVKDRGYRSGINLERAATTAQRSFLYIGDGTTSTVADDVYWDLSNTSLHIRGGTLGTTDILYTAQGANVGFVGIGTTSPLATLHVAGTTLLSGTTAVLTADGGVPMTVTSTNTATRKDVLRLGRTGHAANGVYETLLAFSDDANGTYTAAVGGIRTNAGNDYNGSLAFYTANLGGTPTTGVGTMVEVGRFTNGGFLGIGTASPSATLHVTGSTVLAVNGGNVVLGGTAVATTYNKVTITGGGMTIGDDSSGKLQLGRYSAAVPNAYIKLGANAASLRVSNAADGADILFLTNAGKLGVGSDPLTQLDVKVATDRHIQHVSFGNGAEIYAANDTDAAYTGLYLDGSTIYLSNRAGGNVGVGGGVGFVPAALLHVTGGNLRVDGSGAFIFDGGSSNSLLSSSWNIVASRTMSQAENVVIRAKTTAGIAGLNNPGQIASIGNNVLEVYTAGAQPVVFGVNSAEVMRISSTSNVGIGTTTPAYKLEVSGSFGATTKSFDIVHPTLSGRRLVHGVTESPEHTVFHTQVLRGSGFAQLPSYWAGLVHEDSIRVTLTPVARWQPLYVAAVSAAGVHVGCDGAGMVEAIHATVRCEAVRRDVPQFEVEPLAAGAAQEGA